MALTISGLSTGYRGRVVLKRLDLQPIPAGSLVALVGPNAAGKSTLIKALAGLLPASGDIRLGEENIHAMVLTERLRWVGYLPQSLPQASALVAYESLLAALHSAEPSMAKSKAEQIIESVFDELGLRELAFRRLGELSGGQRQMIGLAQVLVRRPRLMLLDEPTSALDLRWQLKVISSVRRRADEQGSIALFAIHDLNLALRFCDHIVVLSQGEVLASGKPGLVFDAELLARAYGVEGRVEQCSLGNHIVLVDRELDRGASSAGHSSSKS